MKLIDFDKLLYVEFDEERLRDVIAELYDIEFGDQDGQYHLSTDARISVIETGTQYSQTAFFESIETNCAIRFAEKFISVHANESIARHHPTIALDQNHRWFTVSKSQGDEKKYYRIVVSASIHARKNWVG